MPAAQSDRQAPHARRHLQRARGGRTHATGVTTTTTSTTASRAAGREHDEGASQKNVSGRGVYLAECGWVGRRDTKALREKCGGEASLVQSGRGGPALAPSPRRESSTSESGPAGPVFSQSARRVVWGGGRGARSRGRRRGPRPMVAGVLPKSARAQGFVCARAQIVAACQPRATSRRLAAVKKAGKRARPPPVNKTGRTEKTKIRRYPRNSGLVDRSKGVLLASHPAAGTTGTTDGTARQVAASVTSQPPNGLLAWGVGECTARRDRAGAGHSTPAAQAHHVPGRWVLNVRFVGVWPTAKERAS